MQEELEKKTVVVITTGAKLTERLLKSLIRKALAEMQRQTQNHKVYRGKQSVKHLLQQGGGASTIEVSSASIRTFERVARKYGVDFAVRKDSAAEKPR